MLNKYIFLVTSIFCVTFKAQVGINTSQPTRTLDINGDLRLRVANDKGNDSNYNKVIVTNDTGDVDFWTKQAIVDKMESLYVVNKKFTASKTGPDPNTIVACGRFQFRYNSPLMPQIKLLTPPSSTTRIYYNRIRKRDSASNDFTTETGRSYNSNVFVDIGRNNQWRDIGVSSDATGNFSNDTLDEYYISYPDDQNIYRVTFLARNAGGNNYNYTMVCEKF